jgi:hypothetical protein
MTALKLKYLSSHCLLLKIFIGYRGFGQKRWSTSNNLYRTIKTELVHLIFGKL